MHLAELVVRETPLPGQLIGIELETSKHADFAC
jgi:hypothetical protein